MDNLSPGDRSFCMSRVRGQNTTPELAVRRILHRMGFRYRVNVRSLPGKPDMVFPARRKVIFIHGCFWHGHSCRAGKNRPSSNAVYWADKLQRNRMRDRRTEAALKRLGWDVLKVWECQIKADAAGVVERIAGFLRTFQQK